MKKSPILLVIVILLSISCYAQQNKGKIFVGGITAFNQYNQNSNGTTDHMERKSMMWGIEIPVGYFVSNAFQVGLIPGYEKYSYTNENLNGNNYYESESENNQFVIGPYARGYINISEKVDFFLDLNAKFGIGKETTSSTQSNFNDPIIRETEGKVRSFSTGIYPGVSIQLSKWLYMDASIGRLAYDYNKYEPDDISNSDEQRKSESFGFAINYFTFGLSTRLGR